MHNVKCANAWRGGTLGSFHSGPRCHIHFFFWWSEVVDVFDFFQRSQRAHVARCQHVQQKHTTWSSHDGAVWFWLTRSTAQQIVHNCLFTLRPWRKGPLDLWVWFGTCSVIRPWGRREESNPCFCFATWKQACTRTHLGTFPSGLFQAICLRDTRVPDSQSNTIHRWYYFVIAKTHRKHTSESGVAHVKMVISKQLDETSLQTVSIRHPVSRLNTGHHAAPGRDAGGETVDANRQSCWGKTGGEDGCSEAEMMPLPNSSERNKSPMKQKMREKSKDESRVTMSQTEDRVIIVRHWRAPHRRR